MNCALQIPSPEEVFVLLQKKVGSARFHTQVDLFPRIAKAVGNQQLTPTQMADAIRDQVSEYSRNFAPCLKSLTEALVPRIVSAIIADEIVARQVQLLLNPHVAYA